MMIHESNSLSLQKIDPKKGHLLVHLPSSKSLSNRVLIIQALCEHSFIMEGISEANDTKILQNILSKYHKQDAIFNVEDAGTCARFLTAFFAITPGTRILTGSKRMHRRPMKPLVDLLRSLNADIEYLENEGFLPIQIKGKALSARSIKAQNEISSQYLSAVLLIAPSFTKDLDIEVSLDQQVSNEYIYMTLALLKKFGIKVIQTSQGLKIPKNQSYQAQNIRIESDWSAASYWYTIACLNPDLWIELPGLSIDSLQGDRKCVEIYQKLGVETYFTTEGAKIKYNPELRETHRFEHDFTHTPDLVLSVAVCCALCKIPAFFTGVQHLRFKESDRLRALKNELRKLGIESIIHENGFEIKEFSSEIPKPIVIKTYDDHRMAMAFAAVACKYETIIENREVVNKSYPHFWSDFMLLYSPPHEQK